MILATTRSDRLRRHDLIGVKVTDPMELDLPQVGMLRIRDAEAGGEL